MILFFLFFVFFFRYKAYRDNNGNYSLFYWELLAVRLGFIIAFEVCYILLFSFFIYVYCLVC